MSARRLRRVSLGAGSAACAACVAVLLIAACAHEGARADATKPPAVASQPTSASPRTPSRPTSRPESRAETRLSVAVEREGALRKRLGEPMPALDIDLAMFGPDFFGTEPTGARFTDDGKTLLFRWKRWDEKTEGTWRCDVADGATPVRMKGDEPLPRSGVVSRSGRRRLVTHKQALLLEDVDGTNATPLIAFTEAPGTVQFDADEKAALVEVGDTLWRVPVDGPGAGPLLSWRNTPAAERRAPAERAESRAARLATELDRQQRELFRRIEEERLRKAAETRPASRPDDRTVPAWSTPAGWSVRGAAASPSARHVAFTIGMGGGAERRDRMADYVTASGYVDVRNVRSLVGDARGESRVVVVDVATGHGVDVTAPADAPRAVATGASWSADGQWLIGQVTTRDRHDGWLVRIDPATGASAVLHHDHDDAWIVGGGGRFLGDSSHYAFISEATGFLSLHDVDVATGAHRVLLGGTFEVRAWQVSHDGSKVIAVAAPTTPHATEILSVDVATGAVEQLTHDGGLRTIALAPDGRSVAEVRSLPAQPWELALRPLTQDASARVLTHSPSTAFDSFHGFVVPPIERIPTGDGAASFPARVYRPTAATRPPVGAAVVFVHGAGYLQNVHDGWSHYEREYAFHHLLAASGYTVVDIDYRGSAGYGRDFRAAVWGGVGDVDTADCVAAAWWLVKHEGCAPERIGIYGGSYGGFLTLMAQFKHPGVFRAGAALRPVTDWSHYNDGYTTNLLGDAIDDEEVYRRASPITWADGLRDRLLICHGLVDDNVFVKDTIRLTQRLIELRKSGWDVALYPMESHGFTDAASWSDEYRRILELFDSVLGAVRR